MSPDEAVRNFQSFLCSAFPSWLATTGQVVRREDTTNIDDVFADWAQANWELIVERPLCEIGEFLELYGDGTDYEAGEYSRVFFHGRVPTHEIICVARNDTVMDLLSESPCELTDCMFERLVARDGTWCSNRPPFDHVLLSRSDEFLLVPAVDVEFALRATDTS